MLEGSTPGDFDVTSLPTPALPLPLPPGVLLPIPSAPAAALPTLGGGPLVMGAQPLPVTLPPGMLPSIPPATPSTLLDAISSSAAGSSPFQPFNPEPDLDSLDDDAARVTVLKEYITRLQQELLAISSARDAQLQAQRLVADEYRNTAEREIRVLRTAWEALRQEISLKDDELNSTTSALDEMNKRVSYLTSEVDAAREMARDAQGEASAKVLQAAARHQSEMLAAVASAVEEGERTTRKASENGRLQNNATEDRLRNVASERDSALAQVSDHLNAGLRVQRQIAELTDDRDQLIAQMALASTAGPCSPEALAELKMAYNSLKTQAEATFRDAALRSTQETAGRAELQSEVKAALAKRDSTQSELARVSDLLERSDVARVEMTIERDQLQQELEALKLQMVELKGTGRQAHTPAPSVSNMHEMLATMETRLYTRLARHLPPQRPEASGSFESPNPTGLPEPPWQPRRAATVEPPTSELPTPAWLLEWDSPSASIEFSAAWDSMPMEWRMRLRDELENISPSVELPPSLQALDSIILPISDQLLAPDFQVVFHYLSAPVDPIGWMVRRAYHLKRHGATQPFTKPTVANLGAEGPKGEDDRDSQFDKQTLPDEPLTPKAKEWVERLDKSVDEQLDWCKGSPEYPALQKLLRCRVDETGRDWYIRCCYSQEIMRKWAAQRYSSKTNRDAPYRVSDFSPDKLKFPKELADIDPEVVGAAWDGCRRNLWTKLQRALAVAADWHETLQQWSLSAEHATHGNRTIKDRVDEANADSLLKQCPPLQADFLMQLLDATFGRGSVRFGVEAQISQWRSCTQRHADEDLVACGRRHLRAYLKFVDDPQVTATSIWVSRQHRTTFNDALSKSIFNDLGDSQRGEHNQYLFDMELAQRVAKVDGGSGPASEASGLRVIEDKLLYAEQSWTTQRRNKTQTAGAIGADSGANSSSQHSALGDMGAPPSHPTSADMGTPPMVAGVLPPGIDGMPPTGHGRGRGDGGRGKGDGASGRGKGDGAWGKGRGRGTPGGHQSEAPPESGMPPPKADRDRQYQPASRRVIAAPSGSMGHPWAKHGATWAKPAGPDDWDAAMLSTREMKVLYGYQPMRAAVAQCWPCDATLTKAASFDDIIVSGRPVTGWPIEHCKYCYFRGLAPPNTHPDQLYFYGTGDGAHDAARCQALRRFIAEGGNRQKFPAAADHIAGALKFGQTYAAKHEPKSAAGN